MKSDRSKKYIIGFAVAFLLPLSFYLIAIFKGKDKLSLPKHYRLIALDTITVNQHSYQDSIFYQVPDIALTNQLGKEVHLNQDLKNKVLVIQFLFTNCNSVCPAITKNMGVLQKAFKKNDTLVQLISITVDPARDSVAALRAYAERFHVNHDRWWLLTGDKQAIYTYAKEYLELEIGNGDGGVEDLVHSYKLVVLDEQRVIRGYYKASDPFDLKRCADDVVLIGMEKKRKHSLKIK
jgi:protein SCO1/2